MNFNATAAPNTMDFSNLYQTIDIPVEENEGIINTETKQKFEEKEKPIEIRRSRDTNMKMLISMRQYIRTIPMETFM